MITPREIIIGSIMAAVVSIIVVVTMVPFACEPEPEQIGLPKATFQPFGQPFKQARNVSDMNGVKCLIVIPKNFKVERDPAQVAIIMGTDASGDDTLYFTCATLQEK